MYMKARLDNQLAGVKFRDASEGDIDAIAALHADSWRRHYRGAYTDEYLDGDVLADRLAVWTNRLQMRRSEDRCTIVAERDGVLIGFAHTILREHPEWGALLDNLHVQFDEKRSGIGTRLMSESARFVIERTPGSGLYLGVLEMNEAAQAFYEARGGGCVRCSVTDAPGGGTAADRWYYWPDPSVLVLNQ
jgi:ribosomal protein S18 acetylase RimI-like enzyme